MTESLRPVDLKRMQSASVIRIAETSALIDLIFSFKNSRSDQLNMLGLLRLVELQVQTVRRSLVTEARAAGFSEEEVADTLALTTEELAIRYG